MKIFVLILLSAFTFCCKAQMNPQPKKMTEKFFIDPEIEINTPTFLKKTGFTNYQELISYINALKSKHEDLVTISYIGTSQKGKQIPMIRLIKKNGIDDKVRVWFQGCLHGDEPASTEGMLFLMDKILNEEQYSYLLEKLDICIVPMANIDGNEKLERLVANGLDLNRDQTKLMAPESRFLKQAFSDFDAEVAVDFHEYQPFRRDYQQFGNFGITPHYDVMFMYSGNLNVPNILREYTKELFVNNAQKVLDSNKLTYHDYFTSEKVLGEIQIRQGSISARSSATSYALSNAISGLIEIRGGDLGRTSLKRRVYSTFLVAISYLKTAYDNAPNVKAKINNAVQNPNNQVVIKSKTTSSNEKLKVIDVETNNLIEIEVNLFDAWKTIPTLIRNRPTAYILLPTQETLVERIKILGIQVQQLKSNIDIEVENFIIDEYKKDAVKTEGVFRQEVSAKTAVVRRNFPAGSFVVYMNQKKSNLAIEVFEPEAPNSFVSFSVLETDLNQELPIYRYLSKNPI